MAVMARPPGKRNSSIHQLSGGEKALTAVALVFSIFDLNPAPFCLLDEVDAPLDEHNVGRFCDIVRQMSERVQFIFITHNKATMELASQLLGVTMTEPGCSRLVSVDVDEAMRMATGLTTHAELRIILLVVGVVFVAAIAGYEWWRSRGNRPMAHRAETCPRNGLRTRVDACRADGASGDQRRARVAHVGRRRSAGDRVCGVRA